MISDTLKHAHLLNLKRVCGHLIIHQSMYSLLPLQPWVLGGDWTFFQHYIIY